MAEEFLSKEKVKDLFSLAGNVKGTVILTNVEYLKRKGGEEKVERLKKRLKELGVLFDLEKIKHQEMYPEALSVIIILLIKEILGLKKEDIFEMGQAGIKLSPVVKIMTKFFLSLEIVLKKASAYWKEYFDFGSLEVVDFNQEKKYAIVRLLDYKFHPDVCVYHAGYFSQVAKIATQAKEVKIEERKCRWRGDKFDEFYVSWE